MVVKFCAIFNFIFSLSLTSGENSFVVRPFVECVHSRCHFSTLFSPSSLSTTLLIPFLAFCNVLVCRCFLYSVSANSFPLISACALTQGNFIVQFVFIISFSFFLISSIIFVWMLPFRSESNVIWLSVYTVAAFSAVCKVSVYFRAVNIAQIG